MWGGTNIVTLPSVRLPIRIPLRPPWMPWLVRFGVSRVHDVVAIDGQPAGTAEFVVLTDERPLLRQDLDAMVVAVRDDQLALRIELDRVRRPEFAPAPFRFSR